MKTNSISPSKKSEYDKDFYKWTLTQAENLKARKFSNLDVGNLIEEIVSLGKTEKRILVSHLEVLLMHLLKYKYQENMRCKSWDISIKNSRQKFLKVLKENPSLKSKLPEILKDAYESARLEAALETQLDEKIFPKHCPWNMSDIL